MANVNRIQILKGCDWMASIFHCCKCETTITDLKNFKHHGVNCRNGYGRGLYVGTCPNCGFEYGAEMKGISKVDEEWIEYVRSVVETYYKDKVSSYKMNHL